MMDFKQILALPADEIKRMAREDPYSEDLYTALVLKKFMEKYHIRDVNTALEQFLLFKKAQSKLLSLSQEEENVLLECLRKVENDIP